jgi:hypothetical protein
VLPAFVVRKGVEAVSKPRLGERAFVIPSAMRGDNLLQVRRHPVARDVGTTFRCLVRTFASSGLSARRS